jgi:hypothetical protein
MEELDFKKADTILLNAKIHQFALLMSSQMTPPKSESASISVP